MWDKFFRQFTIFLKLFLFVLEPTGLGGMGDPEIVFY